MDILWFQKTSLPTPWSVIENSEGGRSALRAKACFKENYNTKLEFWEVRNVGVGTQTKTLP